MADDNYVNDDNTYYPTQAMALATTSSTATIRIYQPIQYGNRKPPQTSNGNLKCTYIGGQQPQQQGHDEQQFCCSNCQSPLYSLLQFYNSVQQYTVQLYSCNNNTCIRTLFKRVTSSAESLNDTISDTNNNGLHYGGNGIIMARQIRLLDTDTKQVEMPLANENDGNTINNSNAMDWTDDGVAGDDQNIDNDSNNDNDNENIDLDDLESQLIAIEEAQQNQYSNQNNKKQSNNKINSNNNEKSPTEITNNNNKMSHDRNHSTGFISYMLHGIQEPPGTIKQEYQKDHIDNNDVEDDDYDMDEVGYNKNTGITTSANSGKSEQNKIQQMLQQYMNQLEDDNDIIQLLQQQSGMTTSSQTKSTTNGNTKSMMVEKDERLSISDRALFTYTDRLKRIPRQVVRHYIGGNIQPLWSIPIITLKQQQQEHQNQLLGKKGNNRARNNSTNNKRKNRSTELFGYEQPIPSCAHCNNKLQFELQVLPSILHILNVDNNTSSATTPLHDDSTTTTTNKITGGGMDWGNIAIYTCQNPLCYKHSKIVDAYCVIQDSIDPIENEEELFQRQQHRSTELVLHPPNGNVASTSQHDETNVTIHPVDATFNIDDDDDDDGIVYEGDEVDDDNSVW